MFKNNFYLFANNNNKMFSESLMNYCSQLIMFYFMTYTIRVEFNIARNTRNLTLRLEKSRIIRNVTYKLIVWFKKRHDFHYTKYIHIIVY